MRGAPGLRSPGESRVEHQRTLTSARRRPQAPLIHSGEFNGNGNVLHVGRAPENLTARQGPAGSHRGFGESCARHSP